MPRTKVTGKWLLGNDPPARALCTMWPRIPNSFAFPAPHDPTISAISLKAEFSCLEPQLTTWNAGKRRHLHCRPTAMMHLLSSLETKSGASLKRAHVPHSEGQI